MGDVPSVGHNGAHGLLKDGPTGRTAGTRCLLLEVYGPKSPPCVREGGFCAAKDGRVVELHIGAPRSSPPTM